MGDQHTKFLFNGAVANTATQYVGLPVHDGALSVQVSWLDATTAATLTLQTTEYGPNDAPLSNTDGWKWLETGEDLSALQPAGSAAGGFNIRLDNLHSKRARLKIVATADCQFQILDGNP